MEELAEKYEGAGGNNYAIQSTQYAAQTFLAGYESHGGFVLSRIEIDMRRTAAADGVWTVSIYATDIAKKPTGSALATYTGNPATDLTTSYAWFKPTFPSTLVSLSPNTRYAIVQTFDSFINIPLWNSTTPTSYGAEGSTSSGDSGATWGAIDTTTICNFKVFASIYIDGRGTVKEIAGSVGTQTMQKDFPVTEGLVAGITKQTGSPIIKETGW